MKLHYKFLPLFILTSSVMFAQSPKDSVPAKVSEQKEIKATNRLRKEMEQRQLTAPPERMAADDSVSSTSAHKPKNKKCRYFRRKKD